MNLIRSEWRKLVYARANWGLLIGAVLLSVFSTAVTPFVLNNQQKLIGLGLDNPQVVDTVYAKGISGYIFAMIIGILLMAGEWRQGTAVATFLTAPKRGSVLAAKLLIGVIAGAITMFVSTGIAIISAQVALSFYPNAAAPSSYTILNTMLSGVLSGVVLSVIGISIGTLIRNQIIAVTGSLIYLNVIDRILMLVWPDAAKWLPSGLITAMMSIDVKAANLGLDTTTYLPPLQASLVLVGYGAVFAAIAVFTSLKRDIE